MTIDEELEAAGLLTVSELMKGQPIDGWMANKETTDLKGFSDWLDMRTKEMMEMKARLILDKKEDCELFEWILAHCAVLQEVRVNFNAATDS